MPPANLSRPRFSGSNTPLVAFETKRTLKMPVTFMREVSIWPPPPTKNREDREKEGWLRPLRKSGEASLGGADGVVRSSTDDWKVNEPPRPRRSKERDHSLDGASTPPLPRRGVWTYLLPASAGRGRNAKFEMYVQVY